MTAILAEKPVPAFPPCRDRLASYLETEGYQAIEYYVSRGQKCWVYQRDLWEAEVIVAVGQRNDRYEEYCLSGNVEAIA